MWSPARDDRMTALVRAELVVQGVFYVLGGLWPLVSLRTFELVTGPKVDGWLVKTVALLLVIIGVALLVAARRREGGAPVWIVAIGAALSLAAIDVVYASVGRISPIYYLDAVAEVVLAGWLIVALALQRRGRG